MIENLFEIRADYEINDNRVLKQEPWIRVFHCPDGANAAIYQGCMSAINRAVSLTTSTTPRNGGRIYTPVEVTIYPFVAPEICSNGWLSGNTGTMPIANYKVDVLEEALQEIMAYAKSFESYSKLKIQIPL